MGQWAAGEGVVAVTQLVSERVPPLLGMYVLGGGGSGLLLERSFLLLRFGERVGLEVAAVWRSSCAGV